MLQSVRFQARRFRLSGFMQFNSTTNHGDQAHVLARRHAGGQMRVQLLIALLLLITVETAGQDVTKVVPQHYKVICG
jgi:hypothetical protein